jgi:hypothetical protein
MLNRYLLEYMGSLVICYAIVFSQEDPFLVGLSHTAVLYLARTSELEGHFTPLTVVLQLFLQRLDFIEGMKILGLHLLAALSIVLLYTQKA